MDNEPWWLSATEQRGLLGNGGRSGRELVAAHLARVEHPNPFVNAIDPSAGKLAMAEACRADASFARGEGPELLHGLPFVVEGTHDNAVVRTMHSSWLPLDEAHEFDELVVQGAPCAGVSVVAMTMVLECAAGSHKRSTVFGATRSPYHARRNQEGQGPVRGGLVAAIVDSGPEPSGPRWERP